MTVGVGLTVIEKFMAVPGQLIDPEEFTGDTVIVAVMAVVPELTAVKEPIFPDPDAANPMDGVLFVQL